MTNTLPSELVRLTAVETALVLAVVGGPLLAKGVMVRRPWVVGVLHSSGPRSRCSSDSVADTAMAR